MPPVEAKRRGKRRAGAHFLADHDRRRLVESDTAHALGNIRADEAEIAGPLHQLARKIPEEGMKEEKKGKRNNISRRVSEAVSGQFPPATQGA